MHLWPAGRKSLSEKMGQADTSRRGFLRNAGITGAIGAAIIGGAEVAGMSSASAATHPGPDGRIKLPSGKIVRAVSGSYIPAECLCEWQCTHSSCGCNGCCPSGTCCFICILVRNETGKCQGNHAVCLSGYGCSTVTLCGE